jgi:HD-GYP domain-containing protein (c-di-GMP phosphodiesterase class II)
VELAQSHHERLDGSGYPYGLTQEDISFESRILAVADVFDAMTTERGYNEVKTFKEAAQELIRLSDKFDRRITRALDWLVDEEAFGTGEAKGEVKAREGLKGSEGAEG